MWPASRPDDRPGDRAAGAGGRHHGSPRGGGPGARHALPLAPQEPAPTASGAEAALTWLNGQAAGALTNDNEGEGYWAAAIAISPDVGVTWDSYWKDTLEARSKALATDAVGNTVKYVIDRMCTAVGAPTNCSFLPSTASLAATGKGESSLVLQGTPQVFYRVTARIEGPRNTVSYVQINVAK